MTEPVPEVTPLFLDDEHPEPTSKIIEKLREAILNIYSLQNFCVDKYGEDEAGELGVFEIDQLTEHFGWHPEEEEYRNLFDNAPPYTNDTLKKLKKQLKNLKAPGIFESLEEEVAQMESEKEG